MIGGADHAADMLSLLADTENQHPFGKGRKAQKNGMGGMPEKLRR
jgi:hypothetical protein